MGLIKEGTNKPASMSSLLLLALLCFVPCISGLGFPLPNNQFRIPGGCSSARQLVNGCGGAGMESVAKYWDVAQFFVGACNKHDVCYGCGEVYGWSQSACDNAFYYDMGRQCSADLAWYDPRKIICTKMKHAFYNKVKYVGSNFYGGKPSSCRLSCVRSFGRP